MAIKNHYFVYQNWYEEKLYANALTASEATEAFNQLNRLIESGGCGDGCAAVGSLTDKNNRWLCERLGILMDFYTVQQMIADGFEFEDAVKN